MNPINRIGQKVRCVGDERVWLTMVCPSLKDYPRKGEVYTVTGFESYHGLAGIHLREVAPLECDCKRISGVPWLISAFRPLDERQTDISEFTSILDKAPTIDRVPAEVD